MNFAVVLHDADRPEIVQLFGTYTTERDADLAMADLSEWPMLRGTWEILPIRSYPASAGAPLLPTIPYMPIIPTYPAQPQWPGNGVIWCGPSIRQAHIVPGWTACAPAASSYTYTWTTGMQASPRDEEPPDMAVPARI